MPIIVSTPKKPASAFQKTPVIFFKPYPSLVGPGEPISIPSVSSKLDYEGEMAVVIGKDATKVSRGNARGTLRP